MLIPFYMKAYCVVNTKACPGASVLGPGALGALKSLLESGVAGAQNKQTIYIYREIDSMLCYTNSCCHACFQF